LNNIDNLVDYLHHVDMLWVTISGYAQATYEINHVGGAMSNVMRHLATISQAKNAGDISTDVLVRYLMFDHNTREKDMMEALATKLGFSIRSFAGFWTSHHHEGVEGKRRGNLVRPGGVQLLAHL
jgi:hypothetical protein